MSSDNYNEYIDKGIHLFRKGVKEAKKLGKKANKEIKKAAGLPTGPCTETNPRYYIVVARQGAMVRKGIEMDSEQVHGLRRADICTVVKISGRRAKIVEPVVGWISLYTADGEVIMRQTLPPDRREQNMHLDRRFEQVKREQERVGGYKEAVKIANDHATAAMGEGTVDSTAGSSAAAAAAERFYQRDSAAGGTAAHFGYANRRDSAQEDSAVATAASLSTVSVRMKSEGITQAGAAATSSSSTGNAIPKLAAPGTLPKLPPPPSRRQQQQEQRYDSSTAPTQSQQRSMDLLGFDDDDDTQQQQQPDSTSITIQGHADGNVVQASNAWGLDEPNNSQSTVLPGLDIFSTTHQPPSSGPQVKPINDHKPSNPFAALQGLGFPSNTATQQQYSPSIPSSTTTQYYHQQPVANGQQQAMRSSSVPPVSSNDNKKPVVADPFADLI